MTCRNLKRINKIFGMTSDHSNNCLMLQTLCWYLLFCWECNMQKWERNTKKHANFKNRNLTFGKKIFVYSCRLTIYSFIYTEISCYDYGLLKVREMSRGQADELRSILEPSCRKNSRPIQPLNGRIVEMYDDTRSSRKKINW